MRFFAFLIGFVVFIDTLSIGNYVYAGNFLSEEEKTSIRDRIVSEQLKINNLYVKFNVIVTKDNNEPPVKAIYEWAMSGEKRYRKNTFYRPTDEPPTERFGLAVWDGKFLKAYDSEINNGSLRNEHDPKNPDHPVTYSPYTRQLGTLTDGMLAEVLTKTKLEDWKAKWADNGKKVILNYDILGYSREWTIDLEKGCMISKYVSKIESYEGKIVADLTLTVSESKEVKSGIWLPTKSNTHGIFYNQDKTIVCDNDIIVEEIKVNEQEIEELFHFEFPDGAQYYDYVIGQTIIPYLTEKVLRQQLDEMTEDIMEIKDEEKSINNIPPSKPARITEKTKPKEKDDFEIAGQTKPNKSSFQKLRWFCFLLITSLFVVVVLYHGFVLKRRKNG